MSLGKRYSWKRVSDDGILKDLPERWDGKFNDTFDSPEDAEKGMEEYIKRLGYAYASSGNCILVCDYFIES